MALETVNKPGMESKPGLITGSLTGERLIVLPTRFWTEARGFLEKAFGKPIGVLIHNFARESGADIATKLKAKGISTPEAIDTIKEIAELLGWGRVDVSGDTKDGSKLLFKIANCAFCSYADRQGRKECDFMSGIACGIAGVFYAKPYHTKLIDSMAGDGQYCEFELLETRRPDQNWKTSVYFPWMIEKKD